MGHFSRALVLALPYRWTMAASFACSVMVALLWGGNISAIFPVVEVVLKGQSLHEWVDEQIAGTDRAAADFRRQISENQAAIAAAGPDEARRLRQDLAHFETRLEAEMRAAERLARVRPWIKTYSPRAPFATLLVVIGLLVAGTLTKSVFLVCGALLDERLAQRATLDLRKAFFRRTLRLDLAQLGSKPGSDLLARFTNDIGTMTLGIQVFFGRTLREPLKVIVCLAGAAWICWRLLFVSLVVVPVAVLLIRYLAKAIKRTSRKALEEMSQLYLLLSETFAGIKVVKAFTMERYERRRFHATAKQFYKKAMKIARYDTLVRPLTEVSGVLIICLAILAGAYLVLNQETHLLGIPMSERPLTLGGLLVFYGLLAGVSDPSRKLADVYGHLQRAIAAADRVFEFFDREPTIVDPPRPTALPRHARELAFENVSFGYRASQPVIVDIDLRIRFGETLAIVGPNGCGKSTLANLVPRFYDPQQGRVLVDGIDVRDVRRRELRGQIGIVTQETLLFDDTVENNIRYGKFSATGEEIRAAAERAHAHRFIVEQLENGYETLVGPGGNRLSGGQRQRIALARAILRDPAILILDEATSQIDLESEQVIHKVLAQFIRGRTTLIITHRLGVLALADRILVMDEGRMLDVGRHDELLARCEFYRRLHQFELRATA
jgi:ATP-binding cassette subfamily B protein/subfamily B ATP-binding cassette protein MsbA